jgi:hypothetical protein
MERIPPVPIFKRGHGACGGIVTLSAHPLLWGEHPFGEPANQSAKLLRKFERKLGRAPGSVKNRDMSLAIDWLRFEPQLLLRQFEERWVAQETSNRSGLTVGGASASAGALFHVTIG